MQKIRLVALVIVIGTSELSLYAQDTLIRTRPRSQETVASPDAFPPPPSTPAPENSTPQSEDFYESQKIDRRWSFDSEPADKLYDDECYNYFDSMKVPKVNQKADQPSGQSALDQRYIAAMRKIYEGGRIVIHDTDTTYAKFLDDHKKKGFGDYAYHFIITPDCRVHEARPLNMMGTHAGTYDRKAAECQSKGSYTLSNDFDFKSIGIAMVGANPSGCNNQIKSLVTSLTRNLGIKTIGGHGHYRVEETDCPGKNLSEFLASNFNGQSTPRLDGTNSGSGSVKSIVDKAYGKENGCREYDGSIPYTQAMSGKAIPKGQLPVNDISSAPVMCNKCSNPSKPASTPKKCAAKSN